MISKLRDINRLGDPSLQLCNNEAIEMQSLDNRDVNTVIFCFDVSKMQQAKKKIKKFREEFEIEFGPNKQATDQEIYGLGIQFFQITQNDQGKIKN